MVMGVFMVFSFLGVSQPQYQRFASVPTLAQAQLYVGNTEYLNRYLALRIIRVHSTFAVTL